jgi:hypothetical protein
MSCSGGTPDARSGRYGVFNIEIGVGGHVAAQWNLPRNRMMATTRSSYSHHLPYGSLLPQASKTVRWFDNLAREQLFAVILTSRHCQVCRASAEMVLLEPESRVRLTTRRRVVA